MQIDALSTQADELKSKDAAQSFSSNAKKFIDSPEFASQKFVSQYQQELRAKPFRVVLQYIENFLGSE